jgi:hypothetical protein
VYSPHCFAQHITMEITETPKPTSLASSSSREELRLVSIDSSSTATLGVTSSAPLPPSAPTSEHCALINFAYRLGAVVKNNDPSIVDTNGVRREAKLLMSLSSGQVARAAVDALASSAAMNQQPKQERHNSPASGRITPQSVTSASSAGSRRETFTFTCPALSLEEKYYHDECNYNNNNNYEAASNRDDWEVNNVDINAQDGDNNEGLMNCPAVMMGRTLKVDDKDAMRLSSDAMARNIMQSFQKAMKWRIQSWVDSLSAVLVQREEELQGNDDKALVDALYYSNEALLVAALRQIDSKIQVLETSTEFKVLHKVTNAVVAAAKKQRLEGNEDDRAGLEEGEYVYHVFHVLELQCALTIASLAGNVHIDLNVPGIVKGTFLSSEDTYNEELTDVNIHVNTDMLATMIERSSRIVVRCSAEALLKGECVVEAKDVKVGACNGRVTSSPQATVVHSSSSLPWPKTTFDAHLPMTSDRANTRSPKRKLTDDDVHPVSGLVVITPARDASSPSDFADSDSDGDTKPTNLQIPDNFHRSKPSGTILYPQACRNSSSKNDNTDLSFATRLPPKKSKSSSVTSGSCVVTPMKTSKPEFERRDKGPIVPLLELASAAALDASI